EEATCRFRVTQYTRSTPGPSSAIRRLRSGRIRCAWPCGASDSEFRDNAGFPDTALRRRRPMPASSPTQPAERSPWTMLLALVSASAMSQAYRTVASIMAPSLQQEFGLSAQALGLFAATFHFSFAALMLAMGIGVDLHGSRRTVLTVFPLAIAGGVVAALAPNFGTLLLGQAMIGIGCSPAFVASTVFISRRFPSERFAAISGIAMATGTIGM